MTHADLVEAAVRWLRSHRCTIVLSEQSCWTGEMPDAIGWKRRCHSVVVECKLTRADFLADRDKPFRRDPALAMGSERYYLAPRGLLMPADLPAHWGLLDYHRRKVSVVVRAPRRSQRSLVGMENEMNLLLASLRRVEVRIEPRTITEFLKWTNRMAAYNGGRTPAGLVAERNPYLEGA